MKTFRNQNEKLLSIKAAIAFQIEAEARLILRSSYPIEYSLIKNSVIFPDDHTAYPRFAFTSMYPGLSCNLLTCCIEAIEVTYEQARADILAKTCCATF